jgi:hypothetical protein
MLRTERDAKKHALLVGELVELFQQERFTIIGAEFSDEFPPPAPLPNDGYGDQEDKAPDVYAFDSARQRYVIGEAKTGTDDFQTEHSLTQFNVFLDQFQAGTGHQALLYVIVPSSLVPEFNTFITHYIHREYWQSIIVVSSDRVRD